MSHARDETPDEACKDQGQQLVDGAYDVAISILQNALGIAAFTNEHTYNVLVEVINTIEEKKGKPLISKKES